MIFPPTAVVIAWVLGLGEHARILSPPGLANDLLERVRLLVDRHTGEPELAAIERVVLG